MFTVQAHGLVIPPSITYPTTEVAEDTWFDLATINQLDSEMEELAEARELVKIAEQFYREVRILKSDPSGAYRIVA